MRIGADVLNIRVKHDRLEIRRQFFSLRVIDSWIFTATLELQLPALSAYIPGNIIPLAYVS